jgi:hypothetical protein
LGVLVACLGLEGIINRIRDFAQGRTQSKSDKGRPDVPDPSKSKDDSKIEVQQGTPAESS